MYFFDYAVINEIGFVLIAFALSLSANKKTGEEGRR
jgi:hypothetical protein